MDPEWRTIYGCMGLAALIYGALNSLASGFARDLLAPGHARRTSPGSCRSRCWRPPRCRPRALPRPAFSSSLIVLLAGAGPVALDGLLGVWLPHSAWPSSRGRSCWSRVSAVMARGAWRGCCIEERAHAISGARRAGRAEESRRAGRLQALASL